MQVQSQGTQYGKGIAHDKVSIFPCLLGYTCGSFDIHT